MYRSFLKVPPHEQDKRLLFQKMWFDNETPEFSLLYLSSDHFFSHRQKRLCLLKSRHEQLPEDYNWVVGLGFSLIHHLPTGAIYKNFAMSSFDKLCFYWFCCCRGDKDLHFSALVKGRGNDAQRLWCDFYLYTEAILCHAAECRKDSQILWQP